MRYIIESIIDEMNIGSQISNWENQNKIRVIEKGDKFDMIKIELIKIKEALRILKRLGINKDVFETYIKAKSKVSKKTLQNVLYYQDEFFKKLGVLEQKGQNERQNK